MEIEKKTEDINRNKIKKLLLIGDNSCFAFLVSFFVYIISIPRGCSYEINTICGVIRIDNFFSYISIIILIIFLITVFLLIFMRLKFRKDKEVIKGLGVIKRLIFMLFVFVLGSIMISVIAISPGGNRCKAMEATRKAEISQLITPQIMYFDNNNRYADNFQELINDNLISEDTAKRLEELGIEIKSSDSEGWYVNVKVYFTEHQFPCIDKVKTIEKVYFCNQSDSCIEK